jgi:trehalose utilization protein
MADEPIRVLVWDEQQPAQKEAYDNFLGNAIAEHLRSKPGLQVRSSSIQDGEQGVSPAVLDFAQVIVWWGHVRHAEIKSELGNDIVSRIQRGQCNLVAIHSAHWSTPFIEAMNEVTRIQLRDELAKRGIENAAIQEIAADRFKAPAREAKRTPYWEFDPPDSSESPMSRFLKLYLPNCCFPAYRNDGKPSFLQVLKPDHPLAKNLPEKFSLPRTEMYDEPFHVPEPDALLLNPSTDKSDNSQKTDLLGCKKTSKMVPPPDLAPAQDVVDVAKVAKEVIPRNTYFRRPLLYTD